MNRYGVVLFHTTSSAIRGEKVVKKAGVECSLIPIPREFSSDCGIALRFGRDDTDRIKDLLEINNVEVSEIRELPNSNSPYETHLLCKSPKSDYRGCGNAVLKL